MQLISHRQAQRWLQSGAELSPSQRLALQAHLEACQPCRDYAAWVERLSTELPVALPYRPPSQTEERSRQDAVLQTAARQRPRGAARAPLSSVLRQAALLGFTAALILAFSWLLRTVVPRNPVGGPAPQTEPTAESTATPLPTSPSLRISAQSSPAEIRELIFNPAWESLALTGYVQKNAPGSDPVFQYVQAWITRGSGRALVSADVPGRFNFNLDVTVASVWSTDGSRVNMLDTQIDKIFPIEPGGWYFHPLESAHPVLATILPGDLAILSSELRIVEDSIILDRHAVVVDWGGSRLWVDAATGLILRRQMQDDSGLPVEVGLLELLINPQLPPWATQLDPIETRRFMELDQHPLPDRSEPTPPPILPGDFNAQVVTLTLVSPPADGSTVLPAAEGSELYFILRSLGAPFSRNLVRVSTACLIRQNECYGLLLPDTPQMEDIPLSWSPDGSQAAYPDVDQNFLYLYSPASSIWQPVLGPALLSSSQAIWAPDGAALLVTLQDESTQGNLATLVRFDGPEARAIAPDLGEMQIPLGWLDAQTALLLWADNIPKGQEGAPQAPRLYAVNVLDGTRREISVPTGANLLKSYPALSPQGDRLVLETPVEGGSELAVMDLASGQIWPFGVAGSLPVWSPDGQWVAFNGPFEDRFAVYTIRPDGTDLKRVFDWPRTVSLAWGRDSRHLLVQTWSQPELGSDYERSALHLVSLDQGWARRLNLAQDEEAWEMVFPSIR